MNLGTYILSKDRNLTNEGYSFFASSLRPEVVTVVKPRNEGTYTVDTVAGTCNCQAGRRGVKCCHLREATSRVMLEKAQVAANAMQANREAFNKMRSADFD